MHPDSWLESRREPLALGAIGAKVAQFQLDTDHHFLSEIPVGSDLYHLPGWQQVAKHSRTQMLHADLCAAGLTDKETGLAIKKPSEIWFTSKHFETSLKDMRCSRDHEHAILQGAYGGENKTARHKYGPGNLQPELPQQCQQSSESFIETTRLKLTPMEYQDAIALWRMAFLERFPRRRRFHSRKEIGT